MQDLRKSQMTEIIYSDKLVEISHDAIHFRHYYFPVGSKKINLKDVEKIEILSPTLINGKWRIHGTGDFRTWFPRDRKRPRRDMIFIIYFFKSWWRTGFTVENSNEVRQIFIDKGLIKNKNFA